MLRRPHGRIWLNKEEFALEFHNMHVHTTLSVCCSDPAATPAAYLARAVEEGVRLIGFSNHYWDESIPLKPYYKPAHGVDIGAIGFYSPQDTAHVLQIKEQIPNDTWGIRVLVGCESEYCGGRHIGISREKAALFDYVLIPVAHLHMPGFTCPGDEPPEEVAQRLVRYFHEVCEFDYIDGIAHPFAPLVYQDRLPELLGTISDDTLAGCFAHASESGIAIELNGGCILRRYDGPNPYLRIFTIAKRMGCHFYFGSDAYAVSSLGCYAKMEAFARQCDFCEDDIAAFSRP